MDRQARGRLAEIGALDLRACAIDNDAGPRQGGQCLEKADLVEKRLMTPEEVLDWFRAKRTEWCSRPGEGPELGFDTTFEEFGKLYDTFDEVDLIYVCDELSIKVTRQEWRQLFAKSGKDTPFRGLCELLAARAYRAEVKPAYVLGRPCAAAGAFETIRSLLAEGGANVSEIAPSTPMEPYLRRWSRVFRLEVAKMAPLPPLDTSGPLGIAGVVMMLLGPAFILVGLAAWALGAHAGSWLCVSGVIMVVLAVAALWASTRLPLSRARYRDPSLKTFRDLAKAIAAHP